MGKPTADKPIPNPILNNKPNKISKPKNRTDRNLKIGTWNICRGLITREHELQQLLKKESIDILFVTETDTKNIDRHDKRRQTQQT